MNMKAELLKLRALPTPRWTLIVCLGCIAIAMIISVFVGASTSDNQAAVGLGGELPTAIAGIVLGAWIFGLEYGQGTTRRTLTADPRRARLAGIKLTVGLLATTALTAVVFVVAAIAYPPIVSGDVSVSAGDVLNTGVAALVGNLTGCILGAAMALLTRSMAGGLTVALFFALVLDTALSAIPSVGDYTLQHSVNDVYELIRNTGSDQDLLRALLVGTAWLGAVSVAGLTRFTRADA
jgi:ABC-type transport system involved in multi-copper enzyme maturation permease subunit